MSYFSGLGARLFGGEPAESVPAPALEIGSHVGSCEIREFIGAGGMGEVYRAWDSKLNREVAVKVLSAEYLRDSERRERFRLEAQALARLNHPHITQVHSFEEAGGNQCIVLELVVGETLGRRLERGRVPVAEALQKALQIAEALEAAHSRGIVHRDLKPSNIQIASDGRVKVLDFGLATIAPKRANPLSTSSTSTVTSPVGSGDGNAIQGTPAYMSPEQANGTSADTRSDIWSFGVVLYEMLTATRAFPGETMVATLGAVMKADPDWTALPEDTPPKVRSLLRRMLQKDRGRRLRDVTDARFQIEEALDEPAAAPPLTVRKGRERVLAAAALLLLATTGALYWRPVPVLPETRLKIVTPTTTDFSYFALSPDGLKIAYQYVTDDGTYQIFLHYLDESKSEPIPGTVHANGLFWSPDSTSIAFFADEQLQTVNITSTSGETVVLVRGLGDAPGGAWGADDVIVFAPSTSGPLQRISAKAPGATPTDVTTLDGNQTGHRFPQFLPGGHNFLFFAEGSTEKRGIYAASLDNKETHRLLDADSAGVFAPPDLLLFVRESRLFAQHLNQRTWQVSGDPIRIEDQILPASAYDAAPVFTASSSGLIAYRSGKVERDLSLWSNVSGPEPLKRDIVRKNTAYPGGARASSADGRVAMSLLTNGRSGIWLLDPDEGTFSRFTRETKGHVQNQTPIWSPRNNGFILFASRREDAPLNLYLQEVRSGDVQNGMEELLFASRENTYPLDWYDRFILFSRDAAQNQGGDLGSKSLGVLELDDHRKVITNPDGSPHTIDIPRRKSEDMGRFHPKGGGWITYQSPNDLTRNTDIFVQRFPPNGQKHFVAPDGFAPQWNPNGKEIFYLTREDKYIRVMAVPFVLSSDGQTPIKSEPIESSIRLNHDSGYTVGPDGQLLINTAVGNGDIPPITVIQNLKLEEEAR